MADLGDDWRRTFSWRYRLALLLLACIWSFSSFIEFRLIHAAGERSELIGLATEQGMLTQRVAFLSSRMSPETACSDSSICTELAEASARLATNHQLLSVGTVRGPARYRSPVSETLQGYVAAAEALAEGSVDERPARLATILSAEGELTRAHMRLGNRMEREAREASAFTQKVTAVGGAASVLTIGLISLLVFRPMARRIGRLINVLDRAQQRAVDAAERAERAGLAKAQFLRTASHELKTPLNAIMGLSDVLRESSDTEDRLLTEMSHASDHLLGILNTMLDTHRMDEGRLVLQPSPTKLVGEVTAVANIARGLATRKGLAFDSEIDVQADAHALIDACRLRQVCLNLLDNAVRYTDEGLVSFRAALEGEGEGRTLRLVIADTGNGIAANRQQAVLAAEAAPNLGPGESGMGLGLSLTRTLVELMSGSIEIHSAADTGTRFEIALPMPEAAEGAEPHTERSGARVLVVDDNLPNRLVAEAMMTMLGARTTLAENGAAAIEAAGREAFDLILMDIAMPHMDGCEAAEAIRSAPGPNQQTPVIAVTAHVAPDEVSAILSRGFAAVVHKPMRKARMVELYRRYVGGCEEERKRA